MSRLRAAWVLFVVMLVSGCYDIGTPVIELRDAQAIPWVVDTWTFPRGNQLVVYQGGAANEYRYRRVSGSNVSTGTFRAVALGGNIYLIQAIDDSGDVFALFYRRAADGSIHELNVSDRVKDLARRFGVTIDDIDGGLMLDGPAAQVRAFLLAHTPAHFLN
jgi:hypothetical protein